MGMMHLFVMSKFASFNIQSYLLISITERHTFCCQTVNFFHTEYIQIFIIVQYMLIYLYLIHNVSRHTQTIFQFFECGKENLFDNLQITEISGRKIIHYHHNLLRE